jgi:hypothetical protein
MLIHGACWHRQKRRHIEWLVVLLALAREFEILRGLFEFLYIGHERQGPSVEAIHFLAIHIDQPSHGRALGGGLVERL